MKNFAELYADTAEAAEAFHAKPSSLRHSLCVNGNYLGIFPKKLPNGRLLWPRAEIEKVLAISFNDGGGDNR